VNQASAFPLVSPVVAAPARAVTRPAFKVKLLAQKGCSSIVLDVVGGAALLSAKRITSTLRSAAPPLEKVVDRCMSEGWSAARASRPTPA
jgi:hypothetical protein